ncbi:DNA (cytosine-5)-methyltransferase 1 [Labrenzia sp. EL_142]|nr:DNA (cytosine-5)-methyltransferase 1 [Labrenzia sp. EL_142]
MLKCIDLFAGAGGFSLAAQLAQVNVKLAIEYNKHAMVTFRRNLCTNPTIAPILVQADITSLDPSALYAKCFGSSDNCDLILGGPPCQGFSTHRIKDAGIDDARNNLIHTYFDFVRTFEPAAFLMENVPGMLWPRHKAYLDRFYQEGSEAGYRIFKPIVLDARDFGVPQRRKRVFILGVKGCTDTTDFIWPPKPTHGSIEACRNDPELASWLNCSSVFAPADPEDPNDVHMNHSEELIEAFKRTPANGGSRKDSGRVLECHKNHDGHKDVYGRIDPSLPAPTMTTACINPSKGRFVHPFKHHGITARQAARIQTFPESFVFEGGLIAAGQQIGNAVPVKLGQALIEHIKPLLMNRKRNKQIDCFDKSELEPV